MLPRGDVTIHTSRKKVWDFPADPNQIVQCILGDQKIEKDETNRAKLKTHGTVIEMCLSCP